MRIRASLTKAADGSKLWADRYDRPYKDLFALQDQITSQAANALKAQLQPAVTHSQQVDRPPSGNLEANTAFLRAIHATTFEEANKQYDQAIELDPDYGLAYSKKARMLLDTLSAGGLSGAKAEEAFADADAAVQRAMRVAPDQAATHIARGYLLMLRDFDWQGSEAEFKRAVELAPEDGDAFFQLRKDAAGARKSADAEPAGPWQDFALAFAAQIGADRAAAETTLKNSLDKYAEDRAFQIAQIYAVRGEPDHMFSWLDRAWKARDTGMQTLLYDALLLPYRGDPRYAALAKKVGLPSPGAATLGTHAPPNHPRPLSRE